MRTVIAVLVAAIVLAACGSGSGRVKAGDMQDALARVGVHAMLEEWPPDSGCMRLHDPDMDGAVIVSTNQACDDLESSDVVDSDGVPYVDSKHVDRNVWVHGPAALVDLARTALKST